MACSSCNKKKSAKNKSFTSKINKGIKGTKRTVKDKSGQTWVIN